MVNNGDREERMQKYASFLIERSAWTVLVEVSGEIEREMISRNYRNKNAIG